MHLIVTSKMTHERELLNTHIMPGEASKVFCTNPLRKDTSRQVDARIIWGDRYGIPRMPRNVDINLF